LTKDDITWARFAREAPAFACRRRRPRGRRAQGLRYERRAHEHFEREFGFKYIRSPWYIYKLAGSEKYKWAQPDALLIDIDAGLITICEMKYQHTSEAYWQVVEKYLPLTQKLFGTGIWKFATIEIVKWYDCAAAFPTEITLRDCITKARPGEFGVHIWKP